MERINQYEFYDLGRALKVLAQHKTDMKPQDVLWDMFQAMTTLGNLLEGKPIPLGVSLDAARALRKHLDELDNEHFRAKDAEGKLVFKWPESDAPLIDSWKWERYRNLLETFETIFSAEMREATTYFVPRRGIYLTPALVDTADETFPAHLAPYIPEKTRNDWKAAGKCLAFNLLSATGFHVARAVEGTLEVYYQLFSGKPGETLKNWGLYAAALEEIAASNPTPAPSEKTLAEFKQMKDDYRNPIIHPRIVLNESDARMLFANGESLIIAMAEEICGIKKAQGVQPTLAIVGPAA